MKNFSAFSILLPCCILFASCLKNQDSTADGPKAQLAISNYVVNGASFNVLLDNTTITAAPLSFGGSIATGPGNYAPYGAGIHNLKLNSGTDLVTDNSVALELAKRYSLFFYDTLKNSKVKALLLTDDLVAVDTVGQARFLQLIPGADSLTLLLAKDTLLFGDREAYVGNKSDPALVSKFLIKLPPGNYRLQLQRNGVVIFTQSSLPVVAGKIYSFIARGTINGTGNYKETVTVVQHN